MQTVSTSEVFKKYLEANPGTTVETSMTSISKPELYEYEQKIGKQLFDMNVDDMFGLIEVLSRRKQRNSVTFLTYQASYYQLTSRLRDLFDFYIDNYEIIKNPLNDKRMRGQVAKQKLVEGKEPFTWEYVESIIKRIHADYERNHADYIELLILMYYNGFKSPSEIVNLKPDMIDHRRREVRLPGRTIRISERCYQLLSKFDKMDYIDGYRERYVLKNWRGGYYKFIIKQYAELLFNDRKPQLVCDSLSRIMYAQVNERYDTKISYAYLYYLGFYDFMVSKYGLAKTNEIITTKHDSGLVDLLIEAAREHGMNYSNVSKLKNNLLMFIKEA